MLSRALSLATVTLLIGCFAVIPVQAQNLEAGKSPAQIFAGTCNACHKSPRGLLRTVPAGSLPGFLRQHYTTSGDMASLLSSFLVANGAADVRRAGSQAKQGRDSEAKPATLPDQLDRFGRRLRPPAPLTQQAAKPDAEPRPAARPDAGGLSPQAEPGLSGRNAKRLARPGEAPDAAPATLSKRGSTGGEEPPKTEAARTDAAKTDAAKPEAGKEEAPKGEAVKGEASASEAAKGQGGKPEGAKPSAEGASEAKIETPKETGSGESPALRADPVPPVTPAPAAPAVSAAVSSGMPEPAPERPAASIVAPAPPAVTASVPPPPPIPPAGPPAPPISQ
jgi:hypothetical protein